MVNHEISSKKCSNSREIKTSAEASSQERKRITVKSYKGNKKRNIKKTVIKNEIRGIKKSPFKRTGKKVGDPPWQFFPETNCAYPAKPNCVKAYLLSVTPRSAAFSHHIDDFKVSLLNPANPLS